MVRDVRTDVGDTIIAGVACAWEVGLPTAGQLVGAVRASGQRLCEPCVHLQRITRPGVVVALVHQGGLRADFLGGGEIKIGDRIEATR